MLTADGWLRTGDAARMDDEGFIWIVDRAAARFVSAGQVVYPGDVERVLMAHPSVADAGVVGIPAPDGDEAGVAFVGPVAWRRRDRDGAPRVRPGAARGP